ncbi:MAG: hypothetical protein K8L99_31345 [Anaerolineae bacterium]|nr:hypothetical protein [Anaerolineae bacterium]
MSISYQFEIVTHLEPEVELNQFLNSIEIQGKIRKDIRRGKTFYESFHQPLFWCISYQIDDIDACSELLGIKSNVTIDMHPYSPHSVEVMLLTLRSTMNWLFQNRGDAALLSHCEAVHLYRKDGILILNSDPDVWTPAYLAEINLPYEERFIRP